MGIFNPKRKEVPFETEMSLPAFWVDANGFIIFEKEDLGGCGIFEVMPRTMTPSITHEDPIRFKESTEDRNYKSNSGFYYADARRETIIGWTSFLNALQSFDAADDAIHIQILLKKSRSGEWNLPIEYNSMRTSAFINAMRHDRNISPLMAHRQDDYLSLIEQHRARISSNHAAFSINNLPGYKTKMYLIVSYTPSSEGWWIDGRDSDYYMTDSQSSNYIEQSSYEKNKISDKIADKILKKKTAEEEQGNDIASSLFWIQSDMTAQIIETRMRKIEYIMSKTDMPFALRRLGDREAGGLIAFSNNLLTPYMDRIYGLQVNYNDIYHKIDNTMAIATNDYGKMLAIDSTEQIIYGNVDLFAPKSEEDEFLARFKGIDRNSLATANDEFYDKMLWDPEAVANKENETEEPQDTAGAAFWKSIGEEFEPLPDNGNATHSQMERDFLDRFKNRSLTVQHQRLNEEAKRSDNVLPGEPQHQQSITDFSPTTDAYGNLLESTDVVSSSPDWQNEAKSAVTEPKDDMSVSAFGGFSFLSESIDIEENEPASPISVFTFEEEQPILPQSTSSPNTIPGFDFMHDDSADMQQNRGLLNGFEWTTPTSTSTPIISDVPERKKTETSDVSDVERQPHKPTNRELQEQRRRRR